MSDDAKTREEREREAWERESRPTLDGMFVLLSDPLLTGVRVHEDLRPNQVARLRDALNHRLRELGVES